jgi:hypothetical protein
MSSVNPKRELTGQLAEFAAKIPDPVAVRLLAVSEETTASGVAPGLTVSERAPDFMLPNALGEPVGLARRLAQGPVVISFYRGEWCPFCNLERHRACSVRSSRLHDPHGSRGHRGGARRSQMARRSLPETCHLRRRSVSWTL